MALVILAIIELMKDPTLRVVSNFKINLPRCYYLPFLFMDFKKMKNFLFLIDDVSNIRNLDRYSAIVSNITRKLETDMIFTGQYPKQIPPTIRTQMNYKIYPYYRKHNDSLKIFIKYDTGRKVYFVVNNAVRFIKKYNIYNTREKPPTILERDAIREIAKLSKSVKDIQKYLELYTGDKKEKASLLKEIKKSKHYKGPKKNEDNENGRRIKTKALMELNKKYGVPYAEFKRLLGIPSTTAFNRIRDYEDSIEKSNE